MKIEIDRERNTIVATSGNLILFSGKLGGCDFLGKEQQDERLLILRHHLEGGILIDGGKS